MVNIISLKHQHVTLKLILITNKSTVFKIVSEIKERLFDKMFFSCIHYCLNGTGFDHPD